MSNTISRGGAAAAAAADVPERAKSNAALEVWGRRDVSRVYTARWCVAVVAGLAAMRAARDTKGGM